jgi:hypothetical protein
VQAQHPLRVLGGRGDLHDRDAGGVRRQYRVGVGDHPVQFGEDRGLDGVVFDDGLDDQLAIGQLAQVGGEGQVADGVVAFAFGDLARAHTPLQGLDDPVASGGDQCVGGLEDQHVDAGARRHLGDSGAHLSGADDTYSLDRHSFPPVSIEDRNRPRPTWLGGACAVNFPATQSDFPGSVELASSVEPASAVVDEVGSTVVAIRSK